MKFTTRRHFRRIPLVCSRKSLHACNTWGTMWRVTYPTWSDYLQAIAGDDTGRQIAQKTGNSESTVSRWRSGAYLPEPRQAVAVARIYARNPIEALIAAGYLTEDEAGISVETPRALQLRAFTDIELAREIVRRSDTGGILDEPLGPDHPALQ